MDPYDTLRTTHLLAVAASGSLFALRTGAALAGAAWPLHAPLRWLSYSIDTVLLGAGVALAVRLQLGLTSAPWLAVKLGLIALYVLCGSLALKRGRTACVRRWSALAALLLFGCIVAVARTRDPLGPLVCLLRACP